MKKHYFYGALMAFTWLFVSGSFQIATALTGLLIGIPTAYLFRRFYTGYIHLHLSNIYYASLYLTSFTKDLVISNIDVAYRVLSPGMPINEGMIEYKTRLKSPTAITILANSITLTPGTLVVECRESDGTMLIHCLNIEDKKDTIEGIKGWERLLARVAGEA